ncbi:MAG: XdhC family protein [Gammaproteobacteria bacterium]
MPQYGTDREILQTALDWLQQHHRLALVTVARTWGSSPRPAGSLMVMRDDGQHTGSVSGGCVEEDLVQRYRQGMLAAEFPSIIDYGVDRQQATRFGLPCGGRLELVVEQLDNTGQLQLLLDKIGDNELVNRRVCLRTGEVSLHPAEPADEFDYSEDAVSKVFGPRWQMLLIGAGHLSTYVAQIALMLDYHVIVCDPREEYRATWLASEVGQATEFVREMPDDAVQRYARHPRSIVLALTHDPKLDDMALLDALSTNTFYVGAIGSRQNNAQRRERLRQLGITPRELERLHAPVGLAIGSHTPPEIAVAILAQITALRNQGQSTPDHIANAAQWQF